MWAKKPKDKSGSPEKGETIKTQKKVVVRGKVRRRKYNNEEENDSQQ